MVGLGFQSKCLALRSPDISMGSPPLKQADRSKSITGQEGKRYTARIFTGPLANMTYMAVSSKRIRSWMVIAQ